MGLAIIGTLLIAGLWIWLCCHHIVDPAVSCAVDGIFGRDMHRAGYTGPIRRWMYQRSWDYEVHEDGWDQVVCSWFFVTLTTIALFVGSAVFLSSLVLP